MLRKRALSFMVIFISLLMVNVGMYEMAHAQPKRGGTIIEALGTISEYDAQACFGFGPFVDGVVFLSGYLGLEGSYGWPEYPQWVLDKYPTIHRDP